MSIYQNTELNLTTIFFFSNKKKTKKTEKLLDFFKHLLPRFTFTLRHHSNFKWQIQVSSIDMVFDESLLGDDYRRAPLLPLWWQPWVEVPDSCWTFSHQHSLIPVVFTNTAILHTHPGSTALCYFTELCSFKRFCRVFKVLWTNGSFLEEL